MFGNSASAFAPATASGTGFGLGGATGGLFSPQGQPGSFGMPGQAGAAPAQGPAPTVGSVPYGAFPALPTVSEPKVGISARPLKGSGLGGGGGLGGGRNSPLLSLRSTGAAPRFGVQVRPGSGSPLALISATAAAGSSASAGAAADSNGKSGAAAAGGVGAALLPVRANPHRLFIREPPPGTEAASIVSAVLTPLHSANGNHAQQAAPYGGMDGVHYVNDGGAAGTAGAPAANGHASALAAAAASAGAYGAEEPGNGSTIAGVLPRLGRLAAQGYSFEPSLTQLGAMWRDDPDSLRSVMNFTVSRRGVGQVCFMCRREGQVQHAFEALSVARPAHIIAHAYVH